MKNFVKLWQIHEFSTIFSCFTYICPKLAQFLKYFFAVGDCMIVAFRNSGTALHHTILYCTTEYGTALYCTTLHCTVTNYITLERISLHYVALCCSLVFFENLVTQSNSQTGRTTFKIVAYPLVVYLVYSLSSGMCELCRHMPLPKCG